MVRFHPFPPLQSSVMVTRLTLNQLSKVRPLPLEPMDCIKCESADTIVDDLVITGITEGGELEVSSVRYKCSDCGYAWTR